MDSIENNSRNKVGFFKHVFNFEEESQADMLNIMQYGILAVIPVVILNKLVQTLIPETNEEKGSFEVTAEIMFQVIIMFIGILIIHKMITYIPTYSKTSYSEFNVTSIILAFLVIVLSLQTKLGEKSNLLYERVKDSIEGKTNFKEPIVSSPAPVQSNPTCGPITQQASQQDIAKKLQLIIPGGGSAMQAMPSYAPQGALQQQGQQGQQEQGQQQQGQQGQPGQYGQQQGNGELMAANEALGGSFSLF
jgi:hypothetical protein